MTPASDNTEAGHAPASLGPDTSLLRLIIAERDEWERDRAGSMAETSGWVRRNGWRYVSPADVWDALGPVWDALDEAVQALIQHEAGGPARRRASQELAARKRALRKERSS